MKPYFDVKTGQLLARVTRSHSSVAKEYKIYGISELREDMGLSFDESQNGPSVLFTEEDLPVLKGGELVMALTFPTAGIVQPEHAGFVLSQNFVQFYPDESLDPEYLLFLLNESKKIREQLANSYQSSSLLAKVTVKTLKDLKLPKIPDLETQRVIGRKYILENKLKTMKNKRNELANKKAIEELRRIADEPCS